MKIFIKSFNRPYYLDRCIKSIYLNVIDSDLEIIVLDDGTNPKYLSLIKSKYPEVLIKESPFYIEKVEKIDNFNRSGELISEMEIPTQFWLSSINECAEEYFLLLEDDIWFSDKVDVSMTLEIMQSKNMCMLKLFHLGNKSLVSGKILKLSDEINEIKPKLVTKKPFLFDTIILKNKFKSLSILYRLGLYKNSYKIDYYTIYNVAGVIFSKKYYSHLWKNFHGMVKEDEQLLKAVTFLNTEKNISYGAFNNDILKTSFISSATNMFSGINLNAFSYNYIINESWEKGELDAMSGYPNDILESDIERILEQNKHPLASVAEWKKWVSRFKEQYRNVGHSID